MPAGDINDIGQVFKSPQIQHLGLVQPVTSHERGDTQLVGQPIRMSRTPSQIAAPPPLAGGDADNILKSIGYNDSDIDKLRASKAI